MPRAEYSVGMGEIPPAPPPASTAPSQHSLQCAKTSMVGVHDNGIVMGTTLASDIKSGCTRNRRHPILADAQNVSPENRHNFECLAIKAAANSDNSGNSREARSKVLDEIVICLERKKPNWDKARILHLSSQLEESMFVSEPSLLKYGDSSTLDARISQHCLLLAQRKRAAGEKNGHHSTRHPRRPVAGLQTLIEAQPRTACNILPPANADLHGDAPISGDSRGSNLSGSLMVEEGPRSFDPGGEDEEVEVVKVSREASATGPSPERRRKVGKDQMSPVQVSPSPQIAREVSTMPPSTSQQTADTIPEQHLAMYPPGTGQNGYTSARTTGIVCHDQRHPEQVDNTAGMSSGIQEVNADSTHGLRANTAYTVGEGERDVEGFEERDGRNSSCASSISNGGTSSITMSASVSSQDGGDDGAAYVRRGSHDAEEDKEEAKQHALRLLQSRVLLLSHASRCKEEEGACQLSPLCDSVRQLLQHMQDCSDRDSACQFPHCTSSKAVLLHQRLCRSAGCFLCGSVRELSQKCFWANARHAHKRRLQESHELRRKKRQSEGKPVPPPRKPQSERPKTARELCSGLDEAGNDLGDISLGFFLRQDKAVKARKMSGENPSRDAQDTAGKGIVPYNAATAMDVNNAENTIPPDSNAVLPPTPPVESVTLMLTPVAASVNASASAGIPATSSVTNAGNKEVPGESPTVVAITATVASPGTEGIASSGPQKSVSSAFSRCPRGQVEFAATSHTNNSSSKNDHVGAKAGRGWRKDADVAGGGAEAYSVGASSGGERGPPAHGGGLTVVIPPPGAMEGSLKTPPEMLLDEIAESLRDTSRQPSFAKIQSVQAFLHEHGELRESPSFGDVYALVGQWVNLEDGPGDDDHLGLSSAFSF